MFWSVTLSLFKGLGVSVELFFLTLLFSLPLGLVIAFGSMSKWAPFRRIAKRFPTLAKLAGLPVCRVTDTHSWLARYREKWLQKNKAQELPRMEAVFTYCESI